MGSLFCYKICEKFGYIKPIQGAGMLWILGTLTFFFLSRYYFVVFSRIFKGIAIGLLSVTMPVYATEVIEKKNRGRTLSLINMGTMFGSLTMNILIQFTQNTENRLKYTWGFENIPSIAIILASFLLPESPKVLIANKKWMNMFFNKENLKQFGCDLKLKQVNSIRKKSMENEQLKKIDQTSFKTLFSKKNRKYTYFGIFCQSLVQLTCVNNILHYFSDICETYEVFNSGKYYLMFLLYFSYFIFTLVPFYFNRFLLRKDSLILGCLTITLTYLSIFILLIIFNKDKNTISLFALNILTDSKPPVLTLHIFLSTVYSSLILSMSLIYTTEIFPIECKLKGISICVCYSWIWDSILIITFPYLIQHLKKWIYLLLFFMCLIITIVFLNFPETINLHGIQNDSYIKSLSMINYYSNQFLEFLKSKESSSLNDSENYWNNHLMEHPFENNDDHFKKDDPHTIETISNKIQRIPSTSKSHNSNYNQLTEGFYSIKLNSPFSTAISLKTSKSKDSLFIEKITPKSSSRASLSVAAP